MLGRRAAQKELFGVDHVFRDHVGQDTFYGALGRLGPELFKDESFSGLYGPERGRPSVPPSQLCIALLLQAHDGVADEEAINRTAYDLRWKAALGLGLKEKLCAKSTLQLFRAKLVLHEEYGQIFEASVQACRKAKLLKKRKLDVAIDTTPVLGRGAVKDTYNLISEQVREVVEEACSLKQWDLDQVVEGQGLGRHFAASFKGTVEIDWSDEEQRRALIAQLVGDAKVALELGRNALRGYKRGADQVQPLRRAMELLAELLMQDVDEDPADGAGPQIRKGTRRDRIVSRTDPEMRHGHKSHSKGFEGFKASVVADVNDGVILATDIRAANVDDSSGARDLVEQASANAGKPVRRMFGDTAYGGIPTRRDLADAEIEVVAKAPPLPRRKGCFSLNDFFVDAERGAARCPAGKRSIRRDEIRDPYPGWRYVFSRKDCGPCPLRTQCTPAKRVARMLTVTEATEELQKLRARQCRPAFRRLYRLRTRVEHRIARLVQLGARQARYRGAAKTAFQIAILASVANITLAIDRVVVLFLVLVSHLRPARRLSSILGLSTNCFPRPHDLFDSAAVPR